MRELCAGETVEELNGSANVNVPTPDLSDLTALQRRNECSLCRFGASSKKNKS